jgi:hypothetical protein
MVLFLWPKAFAMPSPKRAAGKEQAMSNTTELEKLKDAIWKLAYSGEDGHVVSMTDVDHEINEAIICEKQRVCANCKHCKPFDINNWRGDVDNKDTASYFEATDDCFSKSPGVLTIFLGEGYCHKFTPREEQK